MKVLGKSTSINVRKVLWTCSELAIPCELEEMGNKSGDLLQPEFLQLNPNAMVPVLIDGDFVLWESNTICRYLASATNNTAVLPSAPESRASVEQWMDWQATELNNSWRYAFMSLVRNSPDYSDKVQIETSIKKWNHNMAILEQQLTKSGPYILGNDFTLADIVIGLSTHRWYSTPMEKPNLPAVKAYYERLSQRPGFMQHGRNGVP